jgi:predicted CopG family antitoxin
MVRPVSLSDPAFAALRGEKRPGESDSDVVLRLVGVARAAGRDPRRFLRFRPKRAMTPEEHEQFLRRMDAADREDPWSDAGA